MGMAVILKKLLMGRMFETERGRIRTFGRMDWIMNPARAFAVMLQNIAERTDEKFLYQLGYEGGKDGAKEMIKCMGLKPRAGWVTQKAIIAMLEFLGYGRPEFLKADIRKDGHHHVILHVRDNPVIEHARTLFGADSKVCHWFMGAFAAHGEMELGIKHTRLRENKCLCKGSMFCEWESKW